MEPFDLLVFQQKARELACPKKLFEFWDDICKRYDRGEIGTYELEEMKEVIAPSLAALGGLRNQINSKEPPPTKRKDEEDAPSAV